MPPPWSFSPLIALNATETSTSFRFGASATHMLNPAFGFAVVWANAKPVFEGAVSSATTFQTLSPLPVCAAFQWAGTLPRSSLLNFMRGPFSSAAANKAAISTIPVTITAFFTIDPPLSRRPWERHHACRTVARRTFQLDPPPVGFHDALHDTQTKNTAAHFPAAGFVYPIKPLKYVRQMFRRNALAGIRQSNDPFFFHSFDRNRNRTRVGVFDGVVQQIHEHLPQPLRVARRGGLTRQSCRLQR